MADSGKTKEFGAAYKDGDRLLIGSLVEAAVLIGGGCQFVGMVRSGQQLGFGLDDRDFAASRLYAQHEGGTLMVNSNEVEKAFLALTQALGPESRIKIK